MAKLQWNVQGINTYQMFRYLEEMALAKGITETRNWRGSRHLHG